MIVKGIGYFYGTKACEFTIKPKLFVTLEQKKAFTYNGADQEIEYDITTNEADESKISLTFSDSADGTYTPAIPKFKNAGTYTVYYKATAPGYENTVQSSFRFVIDKKQLRRGMSAPEIQ